MKKVLLIDDDPVFTSIAQQASKDYGFELVSVSSFKKFRHQDLQAFDAFLIDYDLRDGTGEEVLEFLSEQKILRPVAMISATSHVEDLHPLVSIQPYTFVSKWQDTESFFHRLQEVI